jgi:hypothetical protein
MNAETLSARWRAQAKQLLTYGAESQAITLEACAIELEEAWLGWQRETLTLEQAVEESGYSRSHLNRLIRESLLPNSGTEGETRILRGHLPRKPGHDVAAPVQVSPPSRMQVARAIATEGDI